MSTGIPSRRGEGYTRVAILLHWSIASLVLFNIAFGFFMEGYSPALRGIVVPLHISAGATVLVLTVVRIVWRILNPPPAHLPGLKSWESHLANLVQICLYGMMVAVPLTGWALVSANPPPDSPGAAKAAEIAQAHGHPMRRLGARMIWGVVPLPPIAAFEEIGRTREGLQLQRQLHESTVDLHGNLVILWMLLLVMHIGGACKHQFIDKLDEVARMGLPKRKVLPPVAEE